MEHLANRLYSQYGLRALMTVAATFIAVWVGAHYMAAPGGNVSVLWGLVQYTKALPADVPGTPRQPEIRTRQSGAAIPPPTAPASSVERGSDLRGDDPVATLRRRRNLRELSAMESDRSVAEMPRSTYGFLWGTTLGLWRDSSSWMTNARTQRFTQSTYFEIHRAENGDFFLVGFASAPDAARVTSEAVTNVIPVVTLAATSSDQMGELISIPLSRLRGVDRRDVEVERGVRVVLLDVQLK
jgi:hypothetical protein